MPDKPFPRGLALTAVAGVAAVAAAGWFATRTPPAAAPAPPSTATPVVADAAPAATPSQPIALASSAPGPATPAIAPGASAPFMPPVESAAESLRKVQVALAGGTAQDALNAALTLESCAHADTMANALMQGRESLAQAPPEIKKMADAFPVSGAMRDKALADQRRCQVFDAATLERRGELYQKAFEGGASGSATSYLMWLKGDGAKDKPDPDLVGRVQAAVRADAKAADLGTLATFAYSGAYSAEQAAASPVEAQAYKEAYFRIVDETTPGGGASSRDMVAKLSAFMGKPAALTPGQQREADALAGQVVQAWHSHQHKGG